MSMPEATAVMVEWLPFQGGSGFGPLPVALPLTVSGAIVTLTHIENMCGKGIRSMHNSQVRTWHRQEESAKYLGFE